MRHHTSIVKRKKISVDISGIGSVLKKPDVVENEIIACAMMDMTILTDHDVTDGTPLVRYRNEPNGKTENAKQFLMKSLCL